MKYQNHHISSNFKWRNNYNNNLQIGQQITHLGTLILLVAIFLLKLDYSKLRQGYVTTKYRII